MELWGLSADDEGEVTGAETRDHREKELQGNEPCCGCVAALCRASS